MTEPVAVDPATLRTLTDRVTAIADELAALAIKPLAPAAGSTLGGLAGPGRTTDDVHRFAAAARDWAASARLSVEQLQAADDRTAERLGP